MQKNSEKEKSRKKKAKKQDHEFFKKIRRRSKFVEVSKGKIAIGSKLGMRRNLRRVSSVGRETIMKLSVLKQMQEKNFLNIFGKQGANKEIGESEVQGSGFGDSRDNSELDGDGLMIDMRKAKHQKLVRKHFFRIRNLRNRKR